MHVASHELTALRGIRLITNHLRGRDTRFMGKQESWKRAGLNHRGRQRARWWSRAGGPQCPSTPAGAVDRPSPRLPRRLPARGCGRPGGGGPGRRSVLPRADLGGWRPSQPPPESGTRDKRVESPVSRRRAARPGRAGQGRAWALPRPRCRSARRAGEALPLLRSPAVASPKALCLALSLQGERAPEAWQDLCYSFPWDSFSENSYVVPKWERCTNHVLLYSQLLHFSLGNDLKNIILT